MHFRPPTRAHTRLIVHAQKAETQEKDTRGGLGHGVIIVHAYQERRVNAQVEGDAT